MAGWCAGAAAVVIVGGHDRCCCHRRRRGRGRLVAAAEPSSSSLTWQAGAAGAGAVVIVVDGCCCCVVDVDVAQRNHKEADVGQNKPSDSRFERGSSVKRNSSQRAGLGEGVVDRNGGRCLSRPKDRKSMRGGPPPYHIEIAGNSGERTVSVEYMLYKCTNRWGWAAIMSIPTLSVVALPSSSSCHC